MCEEVLAKSKGFCEPFALFLIFVLFNLMTFTGYSQVNIKSKVVSISENDIPYCHVIIKGTKYGTVTNLNGEFAINAAIEDTLIIRSIGFRQKEIPVNSINDKIYLREDVTMLEEISVISKKEKSKQKILFKGFDKKVTGQYSGPQEVALYIPNQEKFSGKILSIEFELSKIRFDHSIDEKKGKLKNKELLVGLNLYSDIRDMTTDIVNMQSQTLRVKEKQKKIIFDLSTSNIIFPLKGMYISIELLGVYEDDLFVPFNMLSSKLKNQFSPLYSRNHSSPMTYIKYSIGDEFSLNQTKTIDGFSNANFRIKLEAYESP